MKQICLLLLLLAINTWASFIIEVDQSEQNEIVRDHFENIPNDRPVIGMFKNLTLDVIY